eukprot:gnl/MRDRNA2_/MRDRNA2_139777_c0_seq1.p1 gnl/MRDRNA2_/MRDRNA2_139777_c0~~gnl/MRDRNA2_/MRDRNA2_139777_c0_seq1.p1  ORF type:complete len:204 (+),score=41.43 gnl/MRDRNA2_/MRDRNA2_139777_c0_seq1:76-612(+)
MEAEWTQQQFEDHLENLKRFVNIQSPPKALVEENLGPEFSPEAQYEEWLRGPRPQLSELTDFIEAEIEAMKIKERAMSNEPVETFVSPEATGQEAFDRYVEDLVARIRAFPYHGLLGGPHVCAFVRDKVVAPCFEGYWEFYSNRKCGDGFNCETLFTVLAGEGFLLDRLHHVRKELVL